MTINLLTETQLLEVRNLLMHEILKLWNVSASFSVQEQEAMVSGGLNLNCCLNKHSKNLTV